MYKKIDLGQRNLNIIFVAQPYQPFTRPSALSFFLPPGLYTFWLAAHTLIFVPSQTRTRSGQPRHCFKAADLFLHELFEKGPAAALHPKFARPGEEPLSPSCTF